jgi:hypothetical protein
MIEMCEMDGDVIPALRLESDLRHIVSGPRCH